MPAGAETALARVVSVFGTARPHHAYLFANRRANRMKVHNLPSQWIPSKFAQDESKHQSFRLWTTTSFPHSWDNGWDNEHFYMHKEEKT